MIGSAQSKTRHSVAIAAFILICGIPASRAENAPGAAVAPNLSVAPADAQSRSREQMEAFLRTAKVVQMKELSMGVTNSHKALMDDGALQHSAHVQTIDVRQLSYQTAKGTEMNFRDCYKYNLAAYELDKLLDLNMVPASVERTVGGSHAAVTWWVDDVLMTNLERYKKNIQPDNARKWNQQIHVSRVFDQLIYNTDRNLGNLLICRNWNIWLIDHTRAFRMYHHLENPAALVQCDRKLLAKLRELNKETLTDKLRPYLDRMEIEAILARRDKIVAFFDQKIAEKGETAVLFTMERD